MTRRPCPCGLPGILRRTALVLCRIIAAVILSIGGPVLFWNIIWLDWYYDVLADDYTLFLDGEILDSKVVHANESGNWYGITYRYHYRRPEQEKCAAAPERDGGNGEETKQCPIGAVAGAGFEEVWVRKRHYVNLPDCVPDNYDEPGFTAPPNMRAGNCVRLGMIPGAPASALPVATLRKRDFNEVLFYSKDQHMTRQIKLRHFIQTISMFWWFPFALTGGFMAVFLPVETARVLLRPVLTTIVFAWFFVLGPPMGYYVHRTICHDVVSGGERIDVNVNNGDDRTNIAGDNDNDSE